MKRLVISTPLGNVRKFSWGMEINELMANVPIM